MSEAKRVAKAWAEVFTMMRQHDVNFSLYIGDGDEQHYEHRVGPLGPPHAQFTIVKDRRTGERKILDHVKTITLEDIAGESIKRARERDAASE